MNVRTVIAIGLVVLSLPVSARAQFEGVVVLTLYPENGKASQDLTQMLKGTLVRMDMNADAAGGVSMVMNAADGTMTSIVHAQKMYITMNTKALAAKAQGMAGGSTAPDTPPPTISKTGRTETIAGHTCEHYLIDTDPQDLDVCLARDMGVLALGGGAGAGAFGMGRGSMGQLPPGYERLAAEFKDGAFPLKMERVDGSTRTLILLVKAIDAKPMDASLFQVPAGYREFQLPRR